VVGKILPSKQFTSSIADHPTPPAGDECLGKYSESNILKSLHTSKILQSFEDTFSSDDNFVPSLSFIEFLSSQVSKDLSEVVSQALDDLSLTSSKQTSTPPPLTLLDSMNPYATFLSILFASNVTPAVISSASSSSTTKTRLPQLYRINKQDARKFLKEFLLKSSIRMSSGSKIPQFYLDKSFRGSFDLLSNSMSLEKRLDLIESLVSDAQETINALMESFQNDEMERLGSPLFHSSSQ
jgi:hypothetical protein